jgi:hypothetical protein
MIKNKNILKTTAVIAGGGAIIAGAVIGSKLTEKAQTTHFSDASHAMAQLESNAKRHGDDDDYDGPAQSKMEHDLRGANPLIMRDIGQKLVSGAKEGTYTLPNGSKIIVDKYEGRTEVDFTDTKNQESVQLSLKRDDDGDFESLIYSATSLDKDIPGAERIEYDFDGNSLNDVDGLHPQDIANIAGGGFSYQIDNGSSPGYSAAGPDTQIIVGHMHQLENLVDLTAQQSARPSDQ